MGFTYHIYYGLICIISILYMYHMIRGIMGEGSSHIILHSMRYRWPNTTFFFSLLYIVLDISYNIY